MTMINTVQNPRSLYGLLREPIVFAAVIALMATIASSFLIYLNACQQRRTDKERHELEVLEKYLIVTRTNTVGARPQKVIYATC
jgi:hypothetical protein